LPQKQHNSEQLSFQIIDGKDGSPILSAFVFLRNSSIGASSDLDGFVTLDIGTLQDAEIVITHLSYETRSLQWSSSSTLPRQIKLTPRPINFSEVLVQSKKGRSKKRRQWMRRFKQQFFGVAKRKDRVQLLNPDVLWFEEKADTLIAHAVEPLQLLNKSLGYQMKFYLDAFQVDQNEDVAFSGKVFFEDVSNPKDRKSRRIYKKRKRTFHDSRDKFLRDLIGGSIDPQQYEFGQSVIVKAPDSLSYNSLTFNELNISYGSQYDTLFLPGYLTVLHKAQLETVLANVRHLQFTVDDLTVSFLRSTSDYFIFNKNGYLLNQKDIIESGYWTEQRVGSLIPIDYETPLAKPKQPLPRL
ncbi:MAG: hypothetical protein AAFP02_23845, partial [Bacteroidota bacterium]